MKILEQLKSKTAKDSVLILCGNLISQVMSLFVAIVVSRMLTVAEYGLYCVLNNISSFVTDMADMGMNGAITRFTAEYRAKKEHNKENELIYYALRRKIVNLIIVFIILVIGAKPIATFWLHDTQLYNYVYLVIVTCAFSLFVSAMRAVLQGRQQFKKFFISVVTWNFVWSIGIFVMALTGHLSILSSVLSGAISGAINLFLCVRLVRINIFDVFYCNKIEPQIKKKFNSFGNWMLLWALFAILQSKLDVFMLASFAKSEEVSYYDIASKVIKPVLMVVSSYAQVLNPQFAAIEKSNIKSKIQSVIKFIIFISIMIVIAIVLIRPLIVLVFGNKYDKAIFPAQMLLFAIIFYVWTVPFNSALYALNKPYVFTIAAFAGLVVTAVGDYLLLGLYGAIGAAVTYIAAQIVGLIVAFIAYFNVIKKEDI